MTTVSNRTLVILLVTAILFSLVGTLISLDRIGKLGGITGLVTVNGSESTGNVSVTVLSNAEVTLRIDTIALGSWRINGSTTTKNCTLTTQINTTTNAGNNFSSFWFFNGTQATPLGDCILVSAANISSSSFELENTGNIVFTNVTMNASRNGSGEGEPSAAAYDFLVNESHDLLHYRVMEEGNACSDTNAAIPGGNGSTGVLGTQNVTICKQFNYSDTQDAIVVQINITMPSTTPPQSAVNTVTFKAFTIGPT